ncbi:NUDIX hydrolase [Tepidamorphus sp. 3E244]|uniref:NUDIX hydrolase n=1 Tax=Tepidamorphus sp. 3E244 TaxID=3385498 RepID=UPI0038FCF5F5
MTNRSNSLLGSMADAVRSAFALPQRVQFAALAYRESDKGLEYMLLTSRDTGRWIIPKGWPTSNGDGVQTAAQEAWEEAGIRGELAAEPIGDYGYMKKLDAGHEVECRVFVYPMHVTQIVDDFPEVGQRKREWVNPRKAAKRVDEPELSALLLDCAREGVLSLDA